MSGTTRKVLGSGTYQARWVARSNLVQLTAMGMLPCSNYVAQLEKRPERVTPPHWDLVFFIEDTCEKGLKPFVASVVMVNSNGADSLLVRDAAGEHEVPIEHAFEVATKDSNDHVVYARLPKPEAGHRGCVIAPADHLVSAIHYKAFGPAPRSECERFVSEHCLGSVPGFVPGGEIPWPVLA